MKVEPDLNQLENALFSAMVITYTQGLYFISEVSKQNNWGINMAEVCRIWQGGCIIRSELLKILTDIYTKNDGIEHLLMAPEIQKLLAENFEDIHGFIKIALSSRIPLPAFTSALNYFEGMTVANLPANLIQGLRDFFGAHTYERIDEEGIFHSDWNN